MGGRHYSDLIVVGLIGVVGTFIVLYAEEFAFHHNAWCIEGEEHCVREWVTALSGYFATLGAVATILVLWRTLVHMRRSSEMQLRAYLYSKVITLNDIESDRPRFVVTFANKGQTPAVSIKAEWWAGALRTPLGEDVDFPEPDQAYNLGAMGPRDDGSLECFLRADVLADARPQLRVGTHRFWVRFRLTYVDVFGQRRSTEFFAMNPVNRPFGNGPLSISSLRGIRAD